MVTLLIYRHLGFFFAKLVVVWIMAIILLFGCSSKKKVAKEEQVQEIDLLSLITIQTPDWKEDKSMLLDEDNMDKYLDDEADLYLSYRLKRMAVKNYKNNRSLPMLVEIYEFDKSESAYGIYSFDPVGRKENIGQEASYDHGLLRFWKGNMLVRILAQEDFLDIEKNIFEFGRAVDSKITIVGEKPQLISLIPEKAVVPDSLNYFYKNICFNNIYYIPESTALFLSEQTEAVTALYALGNGEPIRLLLIKYPDDIEASVSYGKFGEMYYGNDFALTNKTNIIKTSEDKYDGISLNQNYIIIVFEAENSDICEKLIAATLAKLEIHSEAAKPKEKSDK